MFHNSDSLQDSIDICISLLLISIFLCHYIYNFSAKLQEHNLEEIYFNTRYKWVKDNFE